MSSETGQFFWFWGSGALLAVALYFPANRLITVARIRRAERKLERQTTETERDEIRRKTRIISTVIVICFAFFFNRMILNP